MQDSHCLIITRDSCHIRVNSIFYLSKLGANPNHSLLVSEETSMQDDIIFMFLQSWCDVVARYSTLKSKHPRGRLS